ncbi:MAG: PadR family transcriptional regulator [Streptosporangiales bacterium]|nr:PadR family transcriptional regulator [Streptosporangiales bacterium]MBO0890677.1 PadR family transcriptional regulator [Acidothermales bacterium]
MPARRSASSPLALAVLYLLSERPMHPYEIAAEMRMRGIEYSIKLNYGSLYTVVDALRDAGLIAAQQTVREGRRPERTVYSVTPDGEEAMRNRLRTLLGTAEPEYPRFMAGLCFIEGLPEDEIADLLETRTKGLESAISNRRIVLDGLYAHGLDRVSLVEGEYNIAMLQADLAFVRRLIDDVKAGRMPFRTTKPDAEETDA